MNIQLSKYGKDLGITLIIFIAMLSPRIFELDKFVTADEPIWIMRSSNFYYALGQRDFENTFQSQGTAGIITMWIESAAYMIEYPEYRGYGQGYFDYYPDFNEFIEAKGIDPLVIISTSRVISVVLVSSVVALAFLFTKRMVSIYPALLGFLLISFDPWYLALSRISHTDALQATFQFVSVITFISFMYFRRKPFMLMLSGIFGGIAVLAKFPALINGIAFAFISLVEYLKEIIRNKPTRVLIYFSIGRKYFKILVIWSIILFLTMTVFWPFIWQNPIDLISHFASKVTFYPAEPIDQSSLTITVSQNGDISEGFSFIYYSRYLRGYLWQSTPIILLGLVASMIAFPLRIKVFNNQYVRNMIAGLFWFVVIYTVIMTIPPKSSPRYYLSAHLPLDFIAGVGLVALSQEIASKVKVKREKLLSYGLAAIFIVIQLAGSLRTFPYYFSYYNPLMGGSKRAGEIYFVGIGEGLNEAAEYLNGKKDAENLTAMSWFPIGSFSYFFDGNTVPFIFTRKYGFEVPQRLFEEVDYLVIYNNLRFRPLYNKFIVLIEDVEPEYSIWINNIEYARIYNVSLIKEVIDR